MSARPKNALWMALPVLWMAGCADDEVVWTLFNEPAGATLEVSVVPSEVPESSPVPEDTGLTAVDTGDDGAPAPPPGIEPVTLVSSTGEVAVGQAWVAPESAPVGTEHQVVVVVEDDFEALVGRVTVALQGGRGCEEFTLRQDSADPGVWEVVIESLGSADEQRTDTLTVFLWEPDGGGEELEEVCPEDDDEEDG